MTEKLNVRAAIVRARNELAEEQLEKNVARLKALLRQEATAVTVLANVRREVADLAEAIEQGNV